ncbi:MAG: hypothetical protein JO171_05955 [Paludibacterium sp.]|uniref:hypothetical protein n=1 Tax=Paludibacterium sp. TaxID=1917523 RepID=UPI0025D76BCC|nr:hypothetical protein [Paludibacterium sp.]MBV8046674.1 hypothetical protein [Paludibacterium sp.]MBV8649585.1 hypothetical protein [Paludibacterium sp.]
MTLFITWRRRLHAASDLPVHWQIGVSVIAAVLTLATGGFHLFAEQPRHAGNDHGAAPVDVSPLTGLAAECDLSPIRHIATRLHLAPLLGPPADDTPYGMLIEASAQLLTSGSFEQLHDFVDALSRHPTPFALADVHLSPAKARRLDLHARVICLRSAPQEDSP